LTQDKIRQQAAAQQKTLLAQQQAATQDKIRQQAATQQKTLLAQQQARQQALALAKERTQGAPLTTRKENLAANKTPLVKRAMRGLRDEVTRNNDGSFYREVTGPDGARTLTFTDPAGNVVQKIWYPDSIGGGQTNWYDSNGNLRGQANYGPDNRELPNAWRDSDWMIPNPPGAGANNPPTPSADPSLPPLPSDGSSPMPTPPSDGSSPMPIPPNLPSDDSSPIPPPVDSSSGGDYPGITDPFGDPPALEPDDGNDDD
jgi:hypothetical protein